MSVGNMPRIFFITMLDVYDMCTINKFDIKIVRAMARIFIYTKNQNTSNNSIRWYQTKS